MCVFSIPKIRTITYFKWPTKSR